MAVAAARAYSTALQSIPNAIPTLVNLVTADLEVGGTWFSGGAPARLTVPSGVGSRACLVGAGVFYATGGGNSVVRVKKNAAYIRGTQGYAGTSGISALGEKARLSLGLVMLTDADFVESEVYQDIGAAQNIGAGSAEGYSGLWVAALADAAKAYSTALQSIPNATPTPANLVTAELEVGGTWFSGAAPTRLTVPLGKPRRPYLVGGCLFYASGASVAVARIKVNGTIYVVGDQQYSRTYQSSCCTIGLVVLSAGDYIELEAYQDSGLAQNIGNAALEVNTALWLAAA